MVDVFVLTMSDTPTLLLRPTLGADPRLFLRDRPPVYVPAKPKYQPKVKGRNTRSNVTSFKKGVI